jgi:hypothetical protein
LHPLAGIVGLAHVVVAQDGEVTASLLHPAGGLRHEDHTGQTFRFRGGVGVEGGLGKRLVAEPEPGADDLTGVSLSGDRVVVGRLVDLAVREPGDGDVEGVPEVMDRAGLSMSTSIPSERRASLTSRKNEATECPAKENDAVLPLRAWTNSR